MNKHLKIFFNILVVSILGILVLSFSGCGLSEQEEAEKQALLNDFSDFLITYTETIATIDISILSENAAGRYNDVLKDITRYMEIVAPKVSGEEVDKLKADEIVELRDHVETLDQLLAQLTEIAALDIT